MMLPRTAGFLALTMLVFLGLQSPSALDSVSAASKPASEKRVVSASAQTPSLDEIDVRLAGEALAEMKDTYAHLDGVTVSVGETPHGEQAVAYYTQGRILIDRDHTASIQRILAHEVWHVIDWRVNGKIDWGEQLPPSNADLYALE